VQNGGTRLAACCEWYLSRDADGGDIPAGKRVTLAGDKNYATQELVRELPGMNSTPHVAQNDTNRECGASTDHAARRRMRSVRGNENELTKRSGG
jgi:hypothetical protein